MPRPRSDFAATHAAAAGFEPRLSRAVRRAAEKLRAGLSINDLAMRLAAGDVKGALALLPVQSIESAFTPTQGIVRDAFARGGRVGAEQVSKVAA